MACVQSDRRRGRGGSIRTWTSAQYVSPDSVDDESVEAQDVRVQTRVDAQFDVEACMPTWISPS